MPTEGSGLVQASRDPKDGGRRVRVLPRCCHWGSAGLSFHTHSRARTHTLMYTHTHTHTHTHVHAHTHTLTHTHSHTHTRTHSYTHARTHTHAHTHSLTQLCVSVVGFVAVHCPIWRGSLSCQRANGYVKQNTWTVALRLTQQSLCAPHKIQRDIGCALFVLFLFCSFFSSSSFLVLLCLSCLSPACLATLAALLPPPTCSYFHSPCLLLFAHFVHTSPAILDTFSCTTIEHGLFAKGSINVPVHGVFCFCFVSWHFSRVVSPTCSCSRLLA